MGLKEPKDFNYFVEHLDLKEGYRNVLRHLYNSGALSPPYKSLEELVADGSGISKDEYLETMAVTFFAILEMSVPSLEGIKGIPEGYEAEAKQIYEDFELERQKLIKLFQERFFKGIDIGEQGLTKFLMEKFEILKKLETQK